MDKSVISTFKENIELAASKYDSISVHLNALRQKVLGSKSLDVSKPVTTLSLSNETEVKKVESFEGLASEDQKLDPTLITSDNDFGFCDANSSISEDSCRSQLKESIKEDDEKLSEDITSTEYIQERESEEALNNNGKEVETPLYEDMKREIAGPHSSEKEDNFNSSSTSSDSSSSNEDNENIYSELLKRIEYEEEKRSVNYSLCLQKDKESDSETNESESLSDGLTRISNQDISPNNLTDNNNNSVSTFTKSFSKRAQEIMESIEKDNDEWETLGKQLISRGNQEISYDKLLSLKEKSFGDSEEYIAKLDSDKVEYDIRSINTKHTASKVSAIECKKTDSQKTLCSKMVSKDNLRDFRFDEDSQEVAVSTAAKKVLSKMEVQGGEKLIKKTVSHTLKCAPKKGMKPEKLIKSKPMSTVHKMSSTKFVKNSKPKSNNTKAVSKNIPQKNIQTKPKGDQYISKSFKNNSLKTVYRTKRDESSLNVEKSLKTNLSSEKVKKHMEPLIKSKPDNIFLKKELDRIIESTVNGEEGSGDGPDKVRSQAIIKSMNQSINKLSKPYIPNRFIKSSKKTEIDLSCSSQLPNKLKQQNISSSSNIQKINLIKKCDQPYFNKPAQNILKKVDNHQSDMMLADLSVKSGNKRFKSRGENTVVDPKEILAQLEKEVNFAKCKEIEKNESESKMETYPKVGTSLPASSRQSKIFTPRDIKSELKHNKSEINKIECKNTKQNHEIIKSFPIEVPAKSSKHTISKGERDIKRKSNRKSNKLKNVDSKTEHHTLKRKEILKSETFSNESISNIPNRMLTLDFDVTKPKIINFPFILGQSTSKSYNIQANVQQTMSVMMMLPSESVRRTLSVETKISSKASTQTALTLHSHQIKCPACVIKKDQDDSNYNEVDDPWDTEYTSKNFVRCTCIPRNTVSFKTVMKQLLSDPSIGSLLPISETNTLYEESIDKNNENKQLCRRSDLSHLTKLLHATQRIRNRLVT